MLILLLGLLILGVGLFIYSRKKKSIVGLIASILILSVVLLCLLGNTIDELTISKEDVFKDLKHLAIDFKDDFEIVDNEVTGMPERYQTTQIRVSQRDKEVLVRSIVNSDNFKSLVDEQGNMKYYTADAPESEDAIHNFRYPSFYVRELKLRLDNFPTRLRLSIYDTTNIILYQRIED